MRRRKHRLYVDVTFSNPQTADDAARGLRIMLDRLDLAAAPVWVSLPATYVDKLVVLNARRSVAAKLRER